MGDINWDKLDIKKMGTSQSPASRLLKSLKLKRRKRKVQTSTKTKTIAAADRRTKTVCE